MVNWWWQSYIFVLIILVSLKNNSASEFSAICNMNVMFSFCGHGVTSKVATKVKLELKKFQVLISTYEIIWGRWFSMR